MPRINPKRAYDLIVAAARQHAEDNPEVEDGATHEVGDLQEALWIALQMLEGSSDSLSQVLYLHRDALASGLGDEEADKRIQKLTK